MENNKDKFAWEEGDLIYTPPKKKPSEKPEKPAENPAKKK